MNKEFDDLSVYMDLAKKTIAKFGASIYPALAVEMLKSEDAIADVATAIMYADWRWDNTRSGFNGQKKTQYSYRNQCAIWAIKTYVSQKQKKGNVKVSSCLDKNESSYVSSIPEKSNNNPALIVQEKETQNNLSNTIKQILDSSIITDKQRDQIRQYYYEDKTLSEIGKQYGVTREAIRQNIQKALSKIKEYV
jgi:RNA polymerase sigma factor (sigma-70 family)